MNGEEARDIGDHLGLRLPDELIQWLAQWDNESVVECAISTSTGGVALFLANVSWESLLWENMRLRVAGARFLLHPAHSLASWPAEDAEDDPYSGFWVTRGSGPWRPGATPITPSEWAGARRAARLSDWVVRFRNPFTGEVSEERQPDKAFVGKLPEFGPPRAPSVTHYNGMIVFEGPTNSSSRSAALRLAKALRAQVFDESGEVVD